MFTLHPFETIADNFSSPERKTQAETVNGPERSIELLELSIIRWCEESENSIAFPNFPESVKLASVIIPLLLFPEESFAVPSLKCHNPIKLELSLGISSAVAKLIKKIKGTVSRIEDKIKNITLSKRPKVYIEIWHDPIMSAGSNSFVNDMIELAGGVNVASSLKRAYSKIDPEHIIYNNPDVVILAYMKNDRWVKNEFSNRVGWSSVSAIKKKRV